MVTAAKNGYLYVYVSNEPPNINVYFDNLQVTHIRGPLLQEQSYYPFGLEMAGISDKTLGKPDSKNKFNGGSEIEEDYGVNLYATFFRQYDPQIGRFSGVDCQSEQSIMMSVYQFGANNPVSYNDPLGNKQTRTRGEGEEPGYMSQWNDIYNGLYYGGGGYGGKWVPSQSAEGGSYGYFSSDADAFRNGSMDMDWNNSWGNDGFASSFQDAQSSYYKNGGTDAEVGYLAPNVYLKGFSKQALADLDAQITRNARLGFYSNGYYGSEHEGNGSEIWNYVKEGKGYIEKIETGLDAGKYMNYGKFSTPGIGKWGYWADARGGFQALHVTGNQFIGGRNTAKAFSEGLEKIARPLGAVTTVISGFEAIEDFSNGHTKQGIIHSADTVMGVIGLTGWGAPVAAIYFASRFFWVNDDD